MLGCHVARSPHLLLSLSRFNLDSSHYSSAPPLYQRHRHRTLRHDAAARLENATKELKEPVVISRDTLEAAGRAPSELPLHNILLRGRSTSLAVAALNAQSLAHLLATLSGR
jgi:hypothetical protein